MPTVSAYIKNSFIHFMGEYSRKRTHPFFKLMMLLFLPKELELSLERLVEQRPTGFSYDAINECLQQLGKLSHIHLWVLGIFFQFISSNLVHTYRFLDVMHEQSLPAAHDFISYPLMESMVRKFDFFWLDKHWLDIKHRALHHPEPYSMLHALISLHQNNLLYDWPISKIIPVLMKSADPLTLVEPLGLLAQANLLSGKEGNANLAGLEKHSQPYQWVNSVLKLNRISLLNQNVRAILLTQEHPVQFSDLLVFLFSSGLLQGQQLLEKMPELIHHSDILTSQSIASFWLDVLPANMSPRIYSNIIHICRGEHLGLRQKQEQLRAYLIQTFFPEQAQRMQQVHFNPEQSVHTASINHSLKESLLKLDKLYGDKVRADGHALKAYQTLKILILDKCLEIEHQEQHKMKVEAARRALKRIDNGQLNYEEKSTNTDIHSLLGLIYYAIHDKERCQANVDDVLILLIGSLYELQRGYNLSDLAQDNALTDHSICLAGSFVKLFESLSALHQDCHLIYVTAQSITNKMMCVVNHEVKAYLDQLSLEVSEQQASLVLNNMKNSGFSDEVWALIKPKVEAIMHQEFDDVLTMSSVKKEDFQAILESACDVPLNLEAYQFPKHTQHPHRFFSAEHRAVEDEQAVTSLNI